jgi:hypothetical protein
MIMWSTTMKVTKTDPNRLAKIYAWRKTEKGRAYVKKWSDIATQKRKEKQASLPPKPPKPSRDELLQKRREWQRAWRKTEAGKQSRKREFSSPQARLRKRIRRRLRSLVISAKVSDNNYELIGCTPAFLAKWLESKFQDGMSWSNMGAWHIDHIVPCSAFDLSDKDQLLRCCHYTNLQPLWAKDNLAKSDLIAAHTQEELPIKLTI